MRVFAKLLAAALTPFFAAPAFCGEHIPTLSQALDYMKSVGMEAKVDNVVEKFTPEQQEILFDVIERHGNGKVGLTCKHFDLLRRFAARFPAAPLHYDGDVTPETLSELASFAAGHPTTVWVRQDNKRTAWCKVAPISKEIADLIHGHGFLLGIWILGNEEEMADALQYGADIVETTGGVKPGADRV